MSDKLMNALLTRNCELDAAEFEIESLQAEIAELRAALRPFAEAFAVWRNNNEFGNPHVNCGIGDYRRAWSAMGGTLEKGLPE